MTEAGIRVRWADAGPELRLPATPSGAPGSLAARLARAGRSLNTRCGRQGLCGGCTVQLVSGEFRRHDGVVVVAPAEVKACQGNVPAGTAAVFEVPARSIALHPPQVVTTFKLGTAAAHLPIVTVLPGASDHGLAIDVGTTTVVVALVDLGTGKIIREESAFNRQLEFGDDVVTRIQLAGDPSQRERLQHAIVHETVAPLIRAACAAAQVQPSRIGAVTIAGNTTMLHLLTGTDPTPMGVAPFRPAFVHHRVLTAAELGWDLLGAEIPVHLLPGFSAFVGADLVAGSVCTGLLRDAGPRMLVDVGTNGEILLHHEGRLYATATAAGPAFEGGRLTQGTRAVAGAVAHVDLQRGRFRPRLRFIPGNGSALGLCGSAYVDYLAEARRLELLRPSGRFDDDRWAALPSDHIERCGNTRGVRLRAGDSATSITEADVAHLLQAKAAIAAGILTLLRHANLAVREVKRLYLAGGFGLHLNVRRAIACGLLPGFRPAQVEVVGNTALGGAWLALIDRTVLPEMTRLSRAAEIVELNREPDFENAFIDQLTLP